jgi:hypothetical protein
MVMEGDRKKRKKKLSCFCSIETTRLKKKKNGMTRRGGVFKYKCPWCHEFCFAAGKTRPSTMRG